MQVGLKVNLTATSAVPRPQIADKALCIAITQRGVANKIYEFNSPERFLQELGTPLHDSAKEAYHIVEAGGTVVISPQAHYSDPADKATIDGTKATVDIGTITPTTVNAKEVGAGYNGITISANAPASGAVGVLDITVTTPEGGTQVKKAVPTTLTDAIRDDLNAFFTQVDFTGSGETELEAGDFVLSGGVADKELIVATDLVGSAGSKTGVYSLEGADGNAIGLYNFFSDDAVCAAFDALAQRTARRHYFAPPVGSSFSEIETYLDSSSAKSGYSSCVAGGVRAIDPVTAVTRDFTGIGKLAAVMFRKNAEGVYLSASEERFCVLSGSSGVVTDFSSNEINTLQTKGANVFINRNGSVEFFGFRTTLADENNALAREDIADLALYLVRFLQGTWNVFKGKKNTRKFVRLPFFGRLEQEMNFLISEGTVSQWAFVGDQDLENSEAINNTTAELNSGTWTPKLTVSGVSGLSNLVIGLEVTTGQIQTEIS